MNSRFFYIWIPNLTLDLDIDEPRGFMLWIIYWRHVILVCESRDWPMKEYCMLIPNTLTVWCWRRTGACCCQLSQWRPRSSQVQCTEILTLISNPFLLCTFIVTQWFRWYLGKLNKLDNVWMMIRLNKSFMQSCFAHGNNTPVGIDKSQLLGKY